jgi:catechol-2,3-dioxygenase
MGSPVKLAHIVLQTKDVESMVTWWCTVLEAHVVWQGDGLAFITYDDEHHRIAIVSPPGMSDETRDASTPGMHHVAFTYPALADLFATYERLKEAGLTPTLAINHGPTLSMYYSDPDQNSAELQVDCFPNPEDATAFMNGPYFSRNPIGIRVDPEDLLAKLRAGVPETTLLVRRDVAQGAAT